VGKKNEFREKSTETKDKKMKFGLLGRRRKMEVLGGGGNEGETGTYVWKVMGEVGEREPGKPNGKLPN